MSIFNVYKYNIRACMFCGEGGSKRRVGIRRKSSPPTALIIIFEFVTRGGRYTLVRAIVSVDTISVSHAFVCTAEGCRNKRSVLRGLREARRSTHTICRPCRRCLVGTADSDVRRPKSYTGFTEGRLKGCKTQIRLSATSDRVVLIA